MINSNLSSFQTGVDTLYNKCVSCGSTPSAKTPAAISTSIQSIYTNRYNTGYNTGYNAGYSSGKSSILYNVTFNSTYVTSENIFTANISSRYSNYRNITAANFHFEWVSVANSNDGLHIANNSSVYSYDNNTGLLKLNGVSGWGSIPVFNVIIII